MIIAHLADHPEHLATVATWVHGYWGHLPPPRTLEQIETRFRSHLNRDRAPLTLVALAGSEPVGTASIFMQDMATRPELSPWLAAVYVVPEHRGRGIGSQLVQAIEAKASDLGVSRLYLFTPDRERFYGRLGWVAVERTEYRTESVVIMAKEMSNQGSPGGNADAR